MYPRGPCAASTPAPSPSRSDSSVDWAAALAQHAAQAEVLAAGALHELRQQGGLVGQFRGS